MNKIEMERRQRIADHKQWQLDQQREQTRRELDNAETRRKYLAGLEAEKAEKAKLADIALDIELEPQKQMALRQWLADHPGKTSTDFDKSAWPYLRENLIAERAESERQATIAEARESGRYAL
jgi:predicted RecB family nuclease